MNNNECFTIECDCCPADCCNQNQGQQQGGQPGCGGQMQQPVYGGQMQQPDYCALCEQEKQQQQQQCQQPQQLVPLTIIICDDAKTTGAKPEDKKDEKKDEAKKDDTKKDDTKKDEKKDEKKPDEQKDWKPVKESKAPIIWLAGGPGSGKDTQAKKIAEKYGWTHVAAGDILREEAKNNKDIEKAMNEGNLVPNEVVEEAIRKKMVADASTAKAFIVNGYPREKEQADKFKTNAKEPEHIIYLETPEDVAKERMKARGRPDDTEEAINKKVELAKKNDDAVMKDNEAKVKKVDATKSPDETFDQITKILDEVKVE